MKKSISLFLALLLILTMVGCQQEEEQPTVDGPQYWGSMPALTYGVMESEKLEILPWYGARAEETSNYQMVETEGGFYVAYASWFFYADKTNLNHWVPVCNKPNCSHMDNCNGRVLSDSIIMKNGRLWYQTLTSEVPELYSGEENGYVIVSAAVDGTDRKLEQVVPQALLTTGGSVVGRYTPEQWLVRKEELQTDGTYLAQWMRITDDGVQVFHQVEGLDENGLSGSFQLAHRMLAFRGDRYYQDRYLEPSGTKVFRLEGNTMKWLNLDGLEVSGGYLSGNTLRLFRTNDGYYDVNLDTREEVKLADAQLENSYASIVLPNCIMESTLFGDRNYTPRQNEQTHAMKLFDGQTWRSVALPGELMNAENNEFLIVYCVTSDSILLRRHLAGTNLTCLEYYRIDLTAQEPALEYMGVLDLPM